MKCGLPATTTPGSPGVLLSGQPPPIGLFLLRGNGLRHLSPPAPPGQTDARAPGNPQRQRVGGSLGLGLLRPLEERPHPVEEGDTADPGRPPAWLPASLSLPCTRRGQADPSRGRAWGCGVAGPGRWRQGFGALPAPSFPEAPPLPACPVPVHPLAGAASWQSPPCAAVQTGCWAMAAHLLTGSLGALV